MLGKVVPIWTIVIVEFIIAYLCQTFIGGKHSFKIVFKKCNPKTTQPAVHKIFGMIFSEKSESQTLNTANN